MLHSRCARHDRLRLVFQDLRDFVPGYRLPDPPQRRRAFDVVRVREAFQELHDFRVAGSIDVSVDVDGKVIAGHAYIDHIDVFERVVGLHPHHSNDALDRAGDVVEAVFAFDDAVWIREASCGNITASRTAIA